MKLNNNVTIVRCWVTGWGKDAFGKEGNFQYILKKVDVPVLDSNECEARLRQTRLTQNFQLSRSSFICAGGEEGKDACTVTIAHSTAILASFKTMNYLMLIGRWRFSPSLRDERTCGIGRIGGLGYRLCL